MAVLEFIFLCSGWMMPVMMWMCDLLIDSIGCEDATKVSITQIGQTDLKEGKKTFERN